MNINEIKNTASAVSYIPDQIVLVEQDLIDEDIVYNLVDLCDDLSDLKNYFEKKESKEII